MGSLQAITPSGRPLGRRARAFLPSGSVIGFSLSYALLLIFVFSQRDPTRHQNESFHQRGRPASGAFGTTRSSDEPRQVQHARAQERGRGRHATAPWQIPWAGWKDMLSRTYQQIGEDRLLAVAAGVVFYGWGVIARIK